jgi:hypothetical protein
MICEEEQKAAEDDQWGRCVMMNIERQLLDMLRGMAENPTEYFKKPIKTSRGRCVVTLMQTSTAGKSDAEHSCATHAYTHTHTLIDDDTSSQNHHTPHAA